MRSFVCSDDSVKITDTIVGDGKNVAEAYFHLSPEVKILSMEKQRVITDRAVFLFEGCNSLQLFHENVAKEYNILQSTVCIQVSFSDRLHTIIGEFI